MDRVVHPQLPFPLIIPSTTELWCYPWRLPLCTAPLMLVEHASPAADQPESRAVGQSLATPCSPLDWLQLLPHRDSLTNTHVPTDGFSSLHQL
eukprot:1145065-Pelagomonas_calceolata.AAC.2